jgi:hypothetical protein
MNEKLNVKITLTNSFHNSEINIIAKKIETTFYGETDIYVSQSQMNRIRKKLCGIKGCYCRKVDGSSVKKWSGQLLNIDGSLY